jgi:hypothetical protein
MSEESHRCSRPRATSGLYRRARLLEGMGTDVHLRPSYKDGPNKFSYAGDETIPPPPLPLDVSVLTLTLLTKAGNPCVESDERFSRLAPMR